MKIKHFISTLFLSASLVTAGITFAHQASVEKAEAAISKTVTRVYIEDQVTTTPVLAIESISFASGYGHTQWRDFLTSYLGARSSYTTTSGSAMPSSKGWSYMSNSEQNKYLLCPTGKKNFTMVFPEWVTAFSYKAVGNNWWNWFDVNGSAVGLHSGWGIGKQVKSYIYDDSGWKMNANLDNTAQTNTWGDVTITAIASNGSSEIERKNITMSKYYVMASESYDIFGYTFGGWYTNIGCTTSHTSLITANATVYAKETIKKEAYLACKSNDWKANDDNYLLTPGSDSQYTITISLSKDDEFKIVYNGDWIGWEQVDQSSKLVTSGTIANNGGNIIINSDTKLEIYFKTASSENKIWIQQDSQSEAEVYATNFLASITCTSESPTFALNVWNKVGSETTSMEYKYEQLTEGAKGKLATADPNQYGTLIEQCAARYDRILSKYGYGTGTNQRHDFMGRTPSPIYGRAILAISSIGSSASTTLIAIASVSITGLAVGGYFLLRKKKEN